MSGHQMVFGATEKNKAVFQAAQKHSTRVRILKTALPVAALLIAGIFSWFTFLATPASTMKVQLDPSESGKLVMTSPQLNGYTKDNRLYSMTASRAVQDVNKAGVIALEGIDAHVPLSDTDSAVIDAQSGVYDSINGRLQLDSDFTVKTTNGLEARLKSAEVNIATGQIITEQPVDIRTGNAHILADRMHVTENGKVLLFEDRVKLVIDPSKTINGTTIHQGQKG